MELSEKIGQLKFAFSEGKYETFSYVAIKKLTITKQFSSSNTFYSAIPQVSNFPCSRSLTRRMPS